MTTSQLLQLAASLSWGDGAHHIQPRLRNYPSYAIVSAAQKQQLYAPVRLRVDGQGGLHILNDDYRDVDGEHPVYVIHLAPDGAWHGRTPIPAAPAFANGRHIEDFAVDAEHNIYFLETLATSGEEAQWRLVKSNSTGVTLWATPLSPLSIHERGQLCLDHEGQLHASQRPDQLLDIDPHNGNVIQTVDLPTAREAKLFFNRAGRAFRTMFLEADNRYGLSAIDPATHREQTVVGDVPLYGLLPNCLGVDDQGHFYAYQFPRVGRTGAVVKIAASGQILARYALEELVIQEGQRAILTQWVDEDTERIVITRYEASGLQRRWALAVPDPYRDEAVGEGRLIRVDQEQRLYFLVGEAPGSTGHVLLFDGTGTFLEAISPAPHLRPWLSAVQSHRFWQVDGAGTLYLPVLNPTGLSIVSLRL